MEYPKLKTRPLSTQTCTRFAGLDRRPGASSRIANKSWVMSWHAERNLCSDRWPLLRTSNAQKAITAIDGNTITNRIEAMCGGDHIVLLDDQAKLWCNGHHFSLSSLFSTETAWEMQHFDGISITPETGRDTSGTALGGLTNLGVSTKKTVRFKVVEVDANGAPTAWVCNATGSWQDADLSDYGISVAFSGPVGIGWIFELYMWRRSTCAGRVELLRYGSKALLIYDGKLHYYVDVVKLAAGQTLTAVTDYGFVNVEIGIEASALHHITLTLCDIDGNAMSGVVVSATEPTQEGYWLDISDAKPQLRSWSISQSMWVHISSTYIKVDGIKLVGDLAYNGLIQEQDTIKITATGLAAGTDPLVTELLNSYHYIYKAIPGESSDAVVIAGILPDDAITLEAGTVRLARKTPKMDFIVEAQNRLWGCRYSEADSINEIYASKLGDFFNWDSFQGISTDSWRASRGTGAPFTGAAALQGNPLFFREESVEKVFPSSGGAHQIATYELDGVQSGSAQSMIVIDDSLFYKSRSGICVYTGTVPARISDEFGDWTFTDARAGKAGRKYVCCMLRGDNERVTLVYDMHTGVWHLEGKSWDGVAVPWQDRLYYSASHTDESNLYVFDGGSADGVDWYAETDNMAVELPEHKWITYLRLRFKLDPKARCRVYTSKNGQAWQRKGELFGGKLGTQELAIWPQRCDSFRLRIEGTGGCELQSISYRMERSEGGH